MDSSGPIRRLMIREAQSAAQGQEGGGGIATAIRVLKTAVPIRRMAHAAHEVANLAQRLLHLIGLPRHDQPVPLVKT